MRLLRAAEHRRMPWKNGAGETLEVATAPAGSSMDDFIWRVSKAKVPVSGPFSSFPNVDRTLAVLEGKMVLHVENLPDVVMTASSEPCRFPGDAATSATVIETVTDLNVMTRRQRCRVDVTKIGGARVFSAEVETLLLLGSEAVMSDGCHLLPDDVLWLEAGESAHFLSFFSVAWAIAIHHHRPGCSGSATDADESVHVLKSGSTRFS